MPRALFPLIFGALAMSQVAGQEASVQRGQTLFTNECSRCHIPAEMGARVRGSWTGRSGQELFETIRASMPAETPGSLSDEAYYDLTAYILAASAVEIEAGRMSTDALAAMTIEPGEQPEDGGNSSVAWTQINGDERATRYQPFDQINADNVAELEVAWSLETGLFGPNPESYSTTTPLMVNGRLFATAGSTRNVIALDAASGQLLWMWRPQEDQRFQEAPRKGSGKGVAYYSSGDREVIFTMTPGYYLVALDAHTGDPIETFGDEGYVDLMQGLRLGPGRDDVDIGISFPPLVVDDVVVAGAAHEVGMRPVSASNVKGDIRGFDANTGERLWTYYTIPKSGQPGSETWLDGSAAYTGNAGVWAPMSADTERGHVYLPVESATGDRFGGDRPGANLFSSSTVALDYKTGALQWYFQTTHHDIWDWDSPSAPLVVDLPDGTEALVQTLKQSHLFVFDRDTGEPVFPIREKAVPQSDTPGEWSSPTQPYPVSPAPYDRQGFGLEDLVDFTPEIRQRALRLIADYRLSELYTPPSRYRHPEDGSLGTLHLPSSTGGSNWEGAAYDPDTGIIYVSSRTQVGVLSLVNDPDASDIRYIQGPGRPPTVDGIPLVKPPYGRITAIDLNTGEHLWQIVNGDTPDAIANHPLLEDVELPPTGKPTRSGLVATKALLFFGEGPGGDPVLHAVDKRSGDTVARIDLPASVTGVPTTYMLEGKQYIAMAVSDFQNPARILALALPD